MNKYSILGSSQDNQLLIFSHLYSCFITIKVCIFKWAKIVLKNRYEANTNLDSNMSKHILHIILDIKDVAMF